VDQKEHNNRLYVILQKIQAAGLTLNKDKCQFSRSQIFFLGYVIDANGVSPDPHKTDAIRKMKSPTTVTELRRLMGMVNQLDKFSPHIAEISQPLRELLKPNTTWLWTSHHDEALHKLKEEISSHEFWHIMTSMQRLRSVQTFQHMAWERSSCNIKRIVDEASGIFLSQSQ